MTGTRSNGRATLRLARLRRALFLFALLPLLLVATGARAQTPFWTEDFENGCAQLCLASAYSGANGAWRVVDVTPPGNAANTWFVSCAENGNAAGTCGTGCGSDESLHIGNVDNSPAAFIFCPTGDCGAAYDATDASCASDKRAESPVVNATGKAGLSATFVYIGRAQACQDSTDFVYSGDGGTSWTVLSSCIVTNNAGCAGQGRWTTHTVSLPPGADNNPTIRVGFHWRNNGDGVGNDPSFAVDDLVLRYTPATLAVEFDSVIATRTSAGVAVRWSTLFEDDTNGFMVLRSTSESMTDSCVEAVPWVDAHGASIPYVVADGSADAGTAYYYQVQEITSAGFGARSPVVRAEPMVPGLPQSGASAARLRGTARR